MKDYEVTASYKTKIRYHIIFSTKYRKKCLTSIRASVLDAFRECERRSHFRIYEMEIDKDHIHLLVSISPQYSISQVIKRMKTFTTVYLWKKEKDHLSSFYWGRKHKLWTRGAFIATCGDASTETIRKYIETQG